MLNDKSLQRKVEILEKNGAKNELDISLVRPNPYQPRRIFDESKLNDLANSIKEHGVFSPIIVRPCNDYYEIVAGERRYRASLIANKTTIPAIIQSFSDQEMTEIALIENIQREDLSPLEVAKGLRSFQLQFSLTQEELAKRIGKSRSYIANILRLNNLSNELQKELEGGAVSVGHIRTLIGLPEEDALKCLKTIKEKNMNVRETEDFLAEFKARRDNKDKKDKEQKLSEKLKTKVKITKNQINIAYDGDEDLKSILWELLGKK